MPSSPPGDGGRSIIGSTARRRAVATRGATGEAVASSVATRTARGSRSARRRRAQLSSMGAPPRSGDRRRDGLDPPQRARCRGGRRRFPGPPRPPDGPRGRDPRAAREARKLAAQKLTSGRNSKASGSRAQRSPRVARRATNPSGGIASPAHPRPRHPARASAAPAQRSPRIARQGDQRQYLSATAGSHGLEAGDVDHALIDSVRVARQRHLLPCRQQRRPHRRPGTPPDARRGTAPRRRPRAASPCWCRSHGRSSHPARSTRRTRPARPRRRMRRSSRRTRTGHRTFRAGRRGRGRAPPGRPSPSAIADTVITSG